MKRILHIIPYEYLYPPKNGGQLRCFNLMDQLSRIHFLDVLVYQKRGDIIDFGYSNSKVRFINSSDYPIKEGIFSYFPSRLKIAIRYRWLTKTIFETASREVLEFSHVIKALASEGNHYDAVIYEHLFSLSLRRVINRYFSNAKMILDAHNIDYKLTENSNLKRKIKEKESHLFQTVDTFWACSLTDVCELEEMNNQLIKGFVIPNGVDSGARPYHHDKSEYLKNVLFCGSLDYAPNIEGLNWFFYQVWPLVLKYLPDLTFTIIGRGNTDIYNYLKQDASIRLIGPVDDVVPYYQNAFVIVVPLLSGSGTRLKVLEAMSMGNPIVSTTIGMEGIEAENGIHALVADEPINFATSIVGLIYSKIDGYQLRKNARALVEEKYDWNVIGKSIIV